jgi:hypothetical protein
VSHGVSIPPWCCRCYLSQHTTWHRNVSIKLVVRSDLAAIVCGTNTEHSSAHNRKIWVIVLCHIAGSRVVLVRCIYRTSDCGVAVIVRVETNPAPQTAQRRLEHIFITYKTQDKDG